MALTITTLTLLNEYINGVMNRADHHGQNVNEIVLTLAGAVIWRATQDVEVRTYNEETANILWLTINGHRYAIAYNHQTGNIEIRDRNQNGNVLAIFNNSTSAKDVKSIFAGL
jgi:Integron cassette protein VCH_CASS1 chain